MKIINIILLLIILFIFCSSISFGLSNITGFSVNSITSFGIINITGLATAFSSALAVMVDANAPDVDIIYPLNDTYNYWDDIALEINYSDISDIDKILYNIDNGENSSITGNTTFSLSADGSHILYIYVNDTHSFLNNSESVTFFINLSESHEIDIPTDYTSDTTNLESMNKEEQENISNLTFHQPDYGKIKFNDYVNLTEGVDHENRSRYIINISKDIVIENIKIFINTTELPCLNKSATLIISNLTFTNPRILRDNEVCPSDICTMESYDDGNLKFNVTGFSEYSAEETPTSSTTMVATGGGGMKKVEIIEFIEENIKEDEKKDNKVEEEKDYLGGIKPVVKEIEKGLEEVKGVILSEGRYLISILVIIIILIFITHHLINLKS